MQSPVGRTGLGGIVPFGDSSFPASMVIFILGGQAKLIFSSYLRCIVVLNDLIY